MMKCLALIIASLIAIGAALVGLARMGILPEQGPLAALSPRAQFVRSWTKTLRRSPDAAAAGLALQGNREGGQVIPMADGSWVAVVMEHACCTGAGFNATLFVTSAREAYLDDQTGSCTWEVLASDLQTYPIQSAAEFLAAARSQGKPLERLP